MSVESLLARLEPLLYGYNYLVFLRVYGVRFAPGEPAEWYIAEALGPSALIGGGSCHQARGVSRGRAIAEVRRR